MKTFKIHPSQCGKIMGNSRTKGELSATCTTFLKEWYAGVYEEIKSKYIDKGNAVEDENIDFMASVLGFGIATKNIITKENDYIIGTCDVELEDTIVDVKSSWNNKTLQEQTSEMDKDYEYQLRCYMSLYDKPKAILFFGLLNTPATDWSEEIDYSHIPANERWLAYSIKRDESIEQEIIAKVIQCRLWLANYDVQVKSKLGKLIEL